MFFAKPQKNSVDLRGIHKIDSNTTRIRGSLIFSTMFYPMAPVGSNEKSNILSVTLILMDRLQISLLIFRFEFKRIN